MAPTTKSPKKRLKTKAPAPAPVLSDSEQEPEEEEPTEEPVEEGGEEEGDEDDVGEGEQAAKKRKRRSNARAKMRGYRSQAARAGIGNRNAVMNVTGVEEVCLLLSPNPSVSLPHSALAFHAGAPRGQVPPDEHRRRLIRHRRV